MTPDELAARFAERFGDDASADTSHGQLTVDIPAASWLDALTFARDELGCAFFDWLTGVDELEAGFSIVAHVWSLTGRHHVLLRTRVPKQTPRLPTATSIYRGAGWHERETYEMFGVKFDGHPHLVPLLLPESFEGHPLRKDFVLAARAAKSWPGAKEPGESDHDIAAGQRGARGAGAPARRRMLPPGVPDPQTWGPRPPGEPSGDDDGAPLGEPS